MKKEIAKQPLIKCSGFTPLHLSGCGLGQLIFILLIVLTNNIYSQTAIPVTEGNPLPIRLVGNGISKDTLLVKLMGLDSLNFNIGNSGDGNNLDSGLFVTQYNLDTVKNNRALVNHIHDLNYIIDSLNKKLNIKDSNIMYVTPKLLKDSLTNLRNNLPTNNGGEMNFVKTVASPLAVNSNGQLSIPIASGSANGYLSSANWTTFNNKPNLIASNVTNGTSASAARADHPHTVANITGLKDTLQQLRTTIGNFGITGNGYWADFTSNFPGSFSFNLDRIRFRIEHTSGMEEGPYPSREHLCYSRHIRYRLMDNELRAGNFYIHNMCLFPMYEYLSEVDAWNNTRFYYQVAIFMLYNIPETAINFEIWIPTN